MRVIGRVIGLLVTLAGMALTGVELLGTEDEQVAEHGLDLEEEATRAPGDLAARAEASIAAQDWRLAAFGFTDCFDR